jgi:hypothetical protein
MTYDDYIAHLHLEGLSPEEMVIALEMHLKHLFHYIERLHTYGELMMQDKAHFNSCAVKVK